MLVQMGGAKLVKGPSFEIRHAMFAGPFRLFDEAIKGRRFPLVPFVCYSADDDRSPYGLVHGMIEPQDEFNERRSRLLWLLKAKQVFVDNDALDQKFNTFQQLAAEVMRPDAMFVMSASRRNPNGLRVEHNLQMSAEQTNVMMDAKQLIQDVPGLYSALLGSGNDGATSGVALNSLVEQSVTSLGETSDNYRTSRRACGDLAMALIAEDLTDENMQVQVGTGKKTRMVVLNTTNEQGIPVNQVEDAEVRVALGDVPTTPAYRSQQQVFLSQAIQAVGNDPIARAVLIPALLESGDLEHRMEYAKWMRQQAGVPEPTDMSDDAAQEQMQAQQQQAAKAGQELQMRGAIAEVAKKEAEAMKTGAQAAVEQARAVQTGALAQREQMTNQGMAPLPEAQAANEDQLIEQALSEALG